MDALQTLSDISFRQRRVQIESEHIMLQTRSLCDDDYLVEYKDCYRMSIPLMFCRYTPFGLFNFLHHAHNNPHTCSPNYATAHGNIRLRMFTSEDQLMDSCMAWFKIGHNDIGELNQIENHASSIRST